MVGGQGVANGDGHGMDWVTLTAAACGAAAAIIAVGPGGASRRLDRLTVNCRTGTQQTVPGKPASQRGDLQPAGTADRGGSHGNRAAHTRRADPDLGAGADGRRRAAASLAIGLGGAVLIGGVAGLPAGLVLGCVAWIRLGRLEPASVVRDREQMVTMLPLAADLMAAALSAGAPPERAVSAVGDTLPGPLGRHLRAVAAGLRVGAEPVSAWAELATEPSLRPLARVMANAAKRGTSPVPSLERIARDSEDVARWAAEARARSVGARAAVPLGLCFLPAFILVGVVPLIATSLRLVG